MTRADDDDVVFFTERHENVSKQICHKDTETQRKAILIWTQINAEKNG
jgi:hypothetical protein